MSSRGPVGPQVTMAEHTPTWLRSQRAVVVDVGEDVVLIGRDGVIRRLAAETAELARVVLAFVATPRSEAEIVGHVETLAGPIGEQRCVIRELLGLLVETGAIGAPPAERVRGAAANVVVGITGAIAASHAPALITALQRRGHAVEVALTPTAARFVAHAALAALVRREVHTSMWPGAAHAPVPHVALAEWADLVLVYPASATTIGRIANGDCSELIAATVLATRAPVVIVPSMNAAMLDAPAVQRNLDRLRADGRVIVHGVPSVEVAATPATRSPIGGAAPAPSEVVSAIDALAAARLLARRDGSPSHDARAWDAAYREPVVPWGSESCDPDIAAALARHAPRAARVLDIGCGLGQIARHAAAAGHRVVATDISEIALAAARARGGDVLWVRDDICATALLGPFDVLVDRAALHALPRSRAAAWAAAIQRLAAPGAIAIVKCHRDGVPGSTTGYSAAELAALLPELELVSAEPAELPSARDRTPIPAWLIVLRRRVAP